jgi:hypothetical protein
MVYDIYRKPTHFKQMQLTLTIQEINMISHALMIANLEELAFNCDQEVDETDDAIDALQRNIGLAFQTNH